MNTKLIEIEVAWVEFRTSDFSFLKHLYNSWSARVDALCYQAEPKDWENMMDSICSFESVQYSISKQFPMTIKFTLPEHILTFLQLKYNHDYLPL